MIKPLTRSASVGTALNKGWALYKENFGLVFLSSLLVGLIAGVSCGICGGPMLCGLAGILLAILRRKDPKPTVGNVFDGFSKFLAAFVTLLVLGILFFAASAVLMVVPVLGALASILLNWAVSPAVSVWAAFLIADQDATIGEAIGTSIKLIGQKEFWSIILVVFVAGLLSGLGIIACGIGLLFTMPLYYCMVAAAYEEVYGGEPAPSEPEALPPAS